MVEESDELSPDDSHAGSAKTATATAEPDDTQHDNPTSATTLSSEEPLNFSDIIHDEGNDNDLSKLLPVADVSAESHNSADQIVAADASHDAGDTYAGGDQAQMDNLIAKPDIDA